MAASISKKVVSRFGTSVPKFQKVLKQAKDRDINESDTVEIITDILEAVLGYDKYAEVTQEFSVRGRYCDVAIRIDGNVQFIIEAKAVGANLTERNIRQTVDYAANYGVHWVILTNGLEWRLYRIRFERPINYDLVFSFDFLTLNPKDQQHQEQLFLLTKEGLEKDARDEFYKKVQIVNCFIIGNIILAEPTLKTIKRELNKMSKGLKVDIQELENIVRTEILRRNLVEGEEAEEAQKLVNRLYKKKIATQRRKKKKELTKSTKSALEGSQAESQAEGKEQETKGVAEVSDNMKSEKTIDVNGNTENGENFNK